MDVAITSEKSTGKASRLLIVGAGGHGHVCAEIAEVLGYQTAFVDDNNPEAIGKMYDLERFIPLFDAVFVAIGNNTLREQLFEKVKSLGGRIVSLVHPTAYISPSAEVSEGTVIAPKAIINTHSKIGKGCILSIGAMVDHDATVESFVHLNAGVICKSGSHIPKGLKIDSGEVIKGY